MKQKWVSDFKDASARKPFPAAQILHVVTVAGYAGPTFVESVMRGAADQDDAWQNSDYVFWNEKHQYSI